MNCGKETEGTEGPEGPTDEPSAGDTIVQPTVQTTVQTTDETTEVCEGTEGVDSEGNCINSLTESFTNYESNYDTIYKSNLLKDTLEFFVNKN